MLAYPRNHDQIGNAARVVYHRLGLRGRRGHDAPSDIRRKAAQILSDEGYRHALSRLRASVHACEEQLLQ
jgi:UDP:flavonoid glycosyltransferase YjiC (YdhE family)